MGETRKYEGLFVFPPQEASDSLKEDEKRLDDVIRRFGGKVLERTDWGRRTLGYPLRKFCEGRIIVWNFELDTNRVVELRRVLELDEKILKSTIVRKEELEPVGEFKKKKESFARPGAGAPKETKEETHGRKS